MSKKKREPVDPEHLKPEDRMKFEIAKELGLADKVIAGGWRCLTAKESGRIGGSSLHMLSAFLFPIGL